MLPVLVIEDLEHEALHLHRVFVEAGIDCRTMSMQSAGCNVLKAQDASLIVIGSLNGDSAFTELLTSQCQSFPAVPIIVLTRTSESLNEARPQHSNPLSAREALRHPIAGCLPHNNVDTDLMRTVQTIVFQSVGNQSRRDPDGNVVSYTVDNDPELLPLIVAQIQRRIACWSFADPIESVRLTVALHEALENGLYHGNLDLSSELRQGDGRAWCEESVRRRTVLPYRDRRLRFQGTIGTEFAEFTIRDEGGGFDLVEVRDCTDSGNLERFSGRGLLLMRMYMDNVQYNASGNEVTLLKRHPDRRTCAAVAIN